MCLGSALSDAADRQPTKVADSTQTPSAPRHPLDTPIRFARRSLDAIQGTDDYEAVFNKREVVGRAMIAHSMDIKVRHRPFSVYLRFRNPSAGREVLYVSGRNQGRLLAHGVGLQSLVGTLALRPESDRAMAENRYPVTQVGMANMVQQVVLQWERERQFREVEVKYFSHAKLGKMDCRVVQTLHPRPRREFKFHMTRLYVDKKTRFPVRVEQFGFPVSGTDRRPLVEQYTYSQIRSQVGLKDSDFDPKNSNYRF
ncbi:MAG: DUF1571 domain-containing protein [Planctomycetaceae bacterium]